VSFIPLFKVIKMKINCFVGEGMMNRTKYVTVELPSHRRTILLTDNTADLLYLPDMIFIINVLYPYMDYILYIGHQCDSIIYPLALPNQIAKREVCLGEDFPSWEINKDINENVQIIIDYFWNSRFWNPNGTEGIGYYSQEFINSYNDLRSNNFKKESKLDINDYGACLKTYLNPTNSLKKVSPKNWKNHNC